MAKSQDAPVGDGQDKEGGGPPRRCPRLKDREDVRVKDLAKERVAEKSNYGNESNLTSSKFSFYICLIWWVLILGVLLKW